MNKSKWLVVPILILLLFVQLIPYTLTDLLGEELVLKVEAYDPRDVFRGDYVAIQFTQERAAKSLLNNDESMDISRLYDKKIYAHLVKDNQDEAWRIDALTLEKPNSGVYISCTLQYFDKYDLVLNLDFGVDRFYVEQNTGSEIEEALRRGEALAKVKVWRGRMIIDDLIIH